MIKNKSILITSFAAAAAIIILTEPAFRSVHNGVFNSFESAFLEPIFIWTLSLLASSIILIAFSHEVFTLWYRKVFIWLVPIGLVITFLTAPGISFGGLSRLATASTLGTILVITTLVFALVQKFRYKK